MRICTEWSFTKNRNFMCYHCTFSKENLTTSIVCFILQSNVEWQNELSEPCCGSTLWAGAHIGSQKHRWLCCFATSVTQILQLSTHTASRTNPHCFLFHFHKALFIEWVLKKICFRFSLRTFVKQRKLFSRHKLKRKTTYLTFSVHLQLDSGFGPADKPETFMININRLKTEKYRGQFSWSEMSARKWQKHHKIPLLFLVWEITFTCVCQSLTIRKR